MRMVTESYTNDAQTCVQAEQEALDHKQETYRMFIQCVEKLLVDDRYHKCTTVHRYRVSG